MSLIFVLSGLHNGEPVYTIFCSTKEDMVAAARMRMVPTATTPVSQLPRSCMRITFAAVDVDPTMATVTVVEVNQQSKFAYGYKPHVLSDGTEGYRLVIQFVLTT